MSHSTPVVTRGKAKSNGVPCSFEIWQRQNVREFRDREKPRCLVKACDHCPQESDAAWKWNFSFGGD